MPSPSDPRWSRDPHTAAKHSILTGYGNAWWPIMLQSDRWSRVTFLDGFAGPGEYLEGEPGSPLLAVRSVLDRPELVASGKQINFIFIERDRPTCEWLTDLLSSTFPSLPGNVHILPPRWGDFADHALPLLTETGAWGSPIFANLDTWGIGDIPFSVLWRIGANKSSEVMVTLISNWFKRFASLQDLAVGDRQFGTRDWRRVRDQPDAASQYRFLAEEYGQTLKRAGFRFAMPFELADESRRSLHLIYATTSTRGVERMKDAMWNVDPIEGTSFRDPKDPDQMSLGFREPNLLPLKRSVAQFLKSSGRVSVAHLKEQFLPTMYKAAHVTAALGHLREEGKLAQDPPGRLVKTTSVWLA